MTDYLKNRFYRLLRWSEKYSKTDMVYLTKGGFWLTFGQGVAMLSGFLISIAFANLFPKESFGTYKFILSVAGIMGIFSLTGIGSAIIQSVASGFENSLSQGFRTNLRWSVGIFLAGIVLSTYYYLNGNWLLSFSFLLVGILTPFTNSASLYGSYLTGKKDFRKSSFYGIIRNIGPVIALIVTLFLTKSLVIIIIVYFVVGALVPLFLYYLTRRTQRHKKNAREDPELVSYTKHLSLMDVIGQIASNLDKILVFHYLGAAQLAIYAFAIAPVEQLQGGKKILSTLIFPKLSEQSFPKLQKSAPRKALLLTVYALSLAGIYVLLIPYFYKFFYPQYLDAVLYSQVYALTLLAIFGTVFDSTLQAHKKKKEMYLHRIIVPIVQISLFFILLPRWGLMGLIVAHVIVRSFSGLLAYYFVEHPFCNASVN